MLSPKIIAATVLLLLLGVAAIAPETTYEALTQRSISDPVDRFNKQQVSSLAAWKEIEAKAEEGDPESMFRLANRIQHHWTVVENEAIPPDSAEAERLFRAAASSGHVKSKIAVWRLEGMDPARIVEIADSALTVTSDKDVLGEVAFFLTNVGWNTCDTEVLKRVEEVQNALQEGSGTSIFSGVIEEMIEDLPDHCQ